MNQPALLQTWRDRAAMLADNGAPDAAFIWRKAAAELEAWFHEEITPAQAEAEGLGDSETVARKLREGRLPNRGRKRFPLVRRGDLVFRAGQKGPETSSIALLTTEAIQARTG